MAMMFFEAQTCSYCQRPFTALLEIATDESKACCVECDARFEVLADRVIDIHRKHALPGWLCARCLRRGLNPIHAIRGWCEGCPPPQGERT